MSALVKQLEAKIESARKSATKAKNASKAEGIELLYDLGAAMVGGAVGALEGAEKMKSTFEIAGNQVPTKLTIALASKVVALASKGEVRTVAKETARLFVGLQAYESTKEAAAKALAEEATGT